MANFYADNDDLRFYLEKGIDWAPLVEATELGGLAEGAFKSPAEAAAFYREIAEMVGEFVAGEVAPHAAAIDREGVRFVDGEAVFPPLLRSIFDKIKDLDLHGLALPRDLGGMNAPIVMYFLLSEMFARADVSVMAHHGFHGGMAAAMLMFSILEGTTTFDASTGRVASTRWGKEIAEIVAGLAWGCMDITEPDAGSDMAAIRTVGEQDEGGNWFVTGQKIFITSGHGKYHFVIARTEKAAAASDDDPMAGLKGLSFFLVPAYREVDGKRERIVKIDRVEEKLGHHGSVTASLSFDRAPAHLVGKRGDGFQQMLMLMNNARLGVGFESIGLCECALRMASEYAAQRPSMGKMIADQPLIADYLDEMRADVEALRALGVYGAVNEEIAQKEKIRRLIEGATEPAASAARARRIREAQAKARRVTPLFKYLASEKAVEMARRCVQIHGGNGYTKDFGAEKLLRDALVMPIYEGTSQIQALMAMKDTLGAIMKDPRRFVRRVAEARLKSLSARDPLERRVAKLRQLSLSAQQALIRTTVSDKFRSLRDKPIAEWPRSVLKAWNPKRDFAFAMLHAERLTRLLADEAIADVLWEQASAHPERREVLERWIERAEPRARFLHDEIATTGQRLLERLAAKDRAAARAAG